MSEQRPWSRGQEYMLIMKLLGCLKDGRISLHNFTSEILSNPMLGEFRERVGPNDLKVTYVNSHDRARELKVIGSPTVRVNGVDIEPGAVAKKNYGIT